MAIRSVVGLLTALVIGLSLAACGGGGGGGAGGSGGPGDVAKKFFEACVRGDVEAAKKFVHPKDLEGMGGAMIGMAVPMMEAEAKAQGGLEKIEIMKVENIDADHAKVEVKVKFKKSEAKTDTVELTKYQGKWYIGEGKSMEEPGGAGDEGGGEGADEGGDEEGGG